MDARQLLLIVVVSGGATGLLLAWRRRTVASPWISALTLALGGWGWLTSGWGPLLAALAVWSAGVVLPARLLVAARRAAARGDLVRAAHWAGWLATLRRRPVDVARRDLYRAAHAWWQGDPAPLDAFCAHVAQTPALDGFVAGAWAFTHQWAPLLAGDHPLGLQVRAHCEQGQVAQGVALAARLWPTAPGLSVARDARLASLAPLAFAGRRAAVEAGLVATRTDPEVAEVWRAVAAWAAGDVADAERIAARWPADAPPALAGVLARRRAQPPQPPELDADAHAVLDDLAREMHAGARLRAGGRAPLIWGVAASLVVAFAAQWWVGGLDRFDPLLSLGGIYVAPEGPAIAGEGRVLRYAWLHGNLAHLLVNLMVITGVGPMVERIYGGLATALIYVGCVLGAAGAILTFGQPGITIGASGGAMGLVSALLVASGWAPILRGTRTARLARTLIVVLVGAQLVWELGERQVSSAGHIGGLLAGAALGALWLAVRPRRASSPGPRTPGPRSPDRPG